MQIYNISRKKHEKKGTFFSGIGDGGSGMEVQREKGKVWKLLNILRFSAFSGKNILRFSAKGWNFAQHFEIFGIFGQKHFEIFGKRVGMELSCRIAKKTGKTARHPPQ